MSDLDLNLHKHFKLYVPYKDYILFETELNKKGIEFIAPKNTQPDTFGGLRYFLKESDRLKIDGIIIKNKIAATTESSLSYDFHEDKKVGAFYLIIVAIFTLIILLIIFYDIIF